MSGHVSDRSYLSIGEVLGLLLEEFPDVTISKIRFLESQGLIDPERTPSGYRKFYDGDVDRLRMILREQRENFLPLKVIRDRLERATIEGDGPTPPRGIRNVTMLPGTDDVRPQNVPSPNHPSAQLRLAAPAVSERDTGETRDSVPVLDGLPSPTAGTPATPATPLPPSSSLPPKRADFRDSYSAVELCALAGISAEQLAEIESFGLVSGRGSGTQALYTGSDLDIATAAAGFLHRGVEGRHLRAWRQAAEREASLFEQLILPQLRQRNPQSREQAVKTLTELSKLGAELRSAILYSALRHHLEGGSSF